MIPEITLYILLLDVDVNIHPVQKSPGDSCFILLALGRGAHAGPLLKVSVKT
jgi:hypothetical protein